MNYRSFIRQLNILYISRTQSNIRELNNHKDLKHIKLTFLNLRISSSKIFQIFQSPVAIVSTSLKKSRITSFKLEKRLDDNFEAHQNIVNEELASSDVELEEFN